MYLYLQKIYNQLVYYSSSFVSEVFIENLYLSVQLFFAWIFFKFLGFFDLTLVIRILLSVLFFFTLLYIWRYLLFHILNNVVFQYSLFISYLWADFLFIFDFGPRLFGLIIGICSCFFPNLVFHDFGSINTIFYIPNLSYFFFSLFFLRFFFKFNQSILAVAILHHSGNSLTLKTYFCWLDIIMFANGFFQNKYTIQNKIKYFEKTPLKIFPLTAKDVEVLQNLASEKPLWIMSESSIEFEKLRNKNLDNIEEKKQGMLIYEKFLKVTKEFQLKAFKISYSS